HRAKWQGQDNLINNIGAKKQSKAIQITSQTVAASLKCIHAVPILIRKPTDSVTKFWSSDKPTGKFDCTITASHNEDMPEITPALSYNCERNPENEPGRDDRAHAHHPEHNQEYTGHQDNSKNGCTD